MVCFFIAVCSCQANASGSSYVVKEHPLFTVEKNAREHKINNPEQYKQLRIEPGDSLQETYRKLILLDERMGYFWNLDASKFDPYTVFLVKQLETAHDRFPESAAIGSLLTLRGWLNGRASVEHNHDRLLEAMSVMIPGIQDFPVVPGIPHTMNHIFKMSSLNCTDEQDRTRLRKILGIHDREKSVKQMLDLLRSYWVTKADSAYSKSYTHKKIKNARDQLTPEKRRTVLRMWRSLLKSVYTANADIIKLRVRKKVQAKQPYLSKKKNQADEKTSRKKVTREQRDKAMKNLRSLEKEPNPLREVYRSVDVLARYKELTEERIPNYDAIKQNLGSYEAELMNTVYMLRVTRESGVIKKLDKLVRERPEGDIRPLMLKAMIERGQGKYKSAKETLSKVLEIEPDHYQAQHKLLYVERKIEEQDR